MKNTKSQALGARHLILCLSLIASTAGASAQVLQISTLAGSPGASGSTDGTGSGAHFSDPQGITVDAAGNIYLADTGNYIIRKVTPAGVVTTVAGTAGVRGNTNGTGAAASFTAPIGITVVSGGTLFVVDQSNDEIRMITPAGVVTSFAGVPGVRGSADGAGSGATFDGPWGIAADAAGNLYVADTQNHTIRKITPAGVVSTLAGTPGSRGDSDGAGSDAQFNLPEGVAVDSSGNVYVADTGNQLIRKITPAGVVSTVAGAALSFGSVDGTGSAARFNNPGALVVDGSGDIFVADSGNDDIRMITPSGVVTTVAGSPGGYGNQDGAGGNARFAYPQGIALDAAGDVYVTDSQYQALRKGVASGAPTIGTSPLTQSVGVGSTVTFKVAASSATQLTYQWSVNGKAISGATSATYTTPPVQLSDQGLYTVAVGNSVGTTQAAASLTATFSHDPTYSFGTWTASAPLPTATTYSAAAYDGSHFVSVGLDGTAYSSSDGLAWTASASNGPPGQTWGELNSILNIPGQGKLVSVGNGGAVVTFASGTYNGTLQNSGTTNLLTGVAAGGSTLVAVGFGGTCITSSLSAASWTAQSTGTSSDLNAIAYGNGTFVAVGLAGTVVTSTDGSKWTAQNLDSTTDLFGVAFGERGFVAVGANGGIFTSPDGALWLQEVAPTSATLVHVGYGDGVYVAVGLLGTVLTSADQGVIWTSQNSGTTARLDGVTLGNGFFVLTGTGGVVVTSGAATPSRLINLSARSTIGTGGNILIAGFVVGGTGSKEVLVRGIGPALSTFGVSDALAQAHLALINGAGTTVASNSVWGGGATLSQAFSAVGAFALPSASADAALLQTLGTGGYTAQVSGVANTTGVGLAEIYDADTGPSTARLINISARASVGTGGNILIAGFVISGTAPETILIRGIGPTLSQFSVPGALSTPQLVLYDSGNNTLQSNSGWGGAANLSQAFAQVGAFSLPSSSADAAILVTLPPGAYTAELSGVNSATGVGLAEIYEVQ